MPSAKEEIRRMLDGLPDDASWEDLQHSIYVRERIERGRREAVEGPVVDQEEVERRMSQWLARIQQLSEGSRQDRPPHSDVGC